MNQNKIFFGLMAMANAFYVAGVSLTINIVYMVWVLMEGEQVLTHNLEALFQSIKSIINPVIKVLDLPKVLVIESRITSQYEILINSLWLALIVFCVFFIVFAVLFLIIDIIVRKKIRFMYYIPSLVFIVYFLYCFATRMLFLMNISFVFIVFLILLIISMMFIMNKYIIVNKVMTWYA